MDWLQTALASILNFLMSVLPESPFRGVIEALPHDLLAQLNWFFNFGAMCDILAVWTAAIAVYYLYMVIMRWVKLIGE